MMQRKGRTLPVVLTVEVLLAVVMYNGTDVAFSGLPAMSMFRLTCAVCITACSLGLFCASVFLEPPPPEEGRRAIRATAVGHLMCLKTDVVIAQLVHSTFSLVAEMSLGSDPAAWLIGYSYASVTALVVAASSSVAFFFVCVKEDPEWRQWSEPMRKAGAGIDQLELLLALGPLALSLADLVFVKEGSLLVRFLPEFWPMAALCVLCVNAFYGLCHTHSLLTGGCYLHSWMNSLYGFRAGSRFLVKAVTGLFVVCKIVRNVIIARSAIF